MDKQTEEPKYHIVSLRVSRQDRDYLFKLRDATKRCISDLMREALHKLPSIDGHRYPAVSRLNSSRRRIRRQSGY